MLEFAPLRSRVGAWAAASIAAVLVVSMPSAVFAEETIFDPERPETEESSDDGSDESSDEADPSGDDAGGGEETIVDPEIPSTDEEESGEGGESSTPSESGDTSFRAAYELGLDLDTRWQGEGEDVVEAIGGGHLELEQALGARWRAVVRGEFRHWMAGRENPDEPDYLLNATEPRAAADMRLGESYALFRADRWTLRLGNLVTSWGSTDIIRPGDVVNPVDLTDVTASSTGGQSRLAQPAIEAAYVQPNWSLTGVVVPFFVPNRVAVFGRDTALLNRRNPLVGSQLPVADIVSRVFDRSLNEEVQPLLLAQSQPDELPGNASLGLRAAGTRWNTDFGLGYFWGWDRTPWLRIDQSVRDLGALAIEDGEVLQDFDLQGFIQRNPEALQLFDDISTKQREGEELVESEYRRMHTVAVDVARYVGPIGLRADVALQPERTFVTEGLRTVRRPTLFAAVGASYEELFDAGPLAITVEGFWLRPAEADDGVTEFFVPESERGKADDEIVLFDDGYWGTAGAVDWATPLWELDLQIGTIVEWQTGGVVVDAWLAKSFGGWFEVSAGGTVYEGPDPDQELSLGGLYDNNDRVGVRLGGSF